MFKGGWGGVKGCYENFQFYEIFRKSLWMPMLLVHSHFCLVKALTFPRPHPRSKNCLLQTFTIGGSHSTIQKFTGSPLSFVIFNQRKNIQIAQFTTHKYKKTHTQNKMDAAVRAFDII